MYFIITQWTISDLSNIISEKRTCAILNFLYFCSLSWIKEQITNSWQVRKQSYITGNSAPHANLGVLNKLISARHELAQVLFNHLFG